jgi:putative acetyltransferase
MADEVLIRAYEPEDLRDLHAIFTCKGVLPWVTTLPSLTLEQLGKRLAGGGGQDVHHLVGALGGRVVGSARLKVWSEPRFRHSGTLAIAVHDDYQGRGVGVALLRAELDLADRFLALRRIQLEVDVDNPRAIAVYEKVGFVQEGRLRCFKIRDGKPVDSIVMARVRESG